MKAFKVACVICSFCMIFMASCKKMNMGSDNSKISYGLGMQFAQDMKNRGLDIDMKAFALAVQDSIQGKPSRLTDDEIRNAFQNFKNEMMKKQISKSVENLKTSEEYLQKNKGKEGVKVTKSGLQYRILKDSAGISPRPTDIVKVHYRGKFVNGTEFDSSYKNKQPVEFALNQVIPGWSEGLQLMKVGSKYELTIPSSLAYGEMGNQNIPGNSVLIFEVELLEVKQK